MIVYCFLIRLAAQPNNESRSGLRRLVFLAIGNAPTKTRGSRTTIDFVSPFALKEYPED